MSSIFGAYLDDYNSIKVIIPINNQFDDIILYGENVNEKLEIKNSSTYGDELHLFLSYKSNIMLFIDYFIKIGDASYHLNLGKITRTKRFEEEFFYDGSLGITYNPDFTEFKVWSPVSKEVILCLNGKKINLNYTSYGVWNVVVKGNLDRYKYYYLIRINEEFEKVLDPYGISSGCNNEYNYVIDFNKTFHMNDYLSNNLEHKFIYEVNLRDLNSNIKNDESTYLKAISHLDYISNLGITHIQLMPTFCFGGVDENIRDNSDEKFQYNWGYNPIQYLIPSGWYASNSDDPYIRINEFKQLIDEIHNRKISVICDVVFNHVYDYQTFSYGKLVPGYVYRTDQQGFLMNSSYCGNDLRTEAKMIRKYLVDIIKFYLVNYKIDGFRFDLMGLIDNDTMIEIMDNTFKINENLLLYGEGWYMSTTLKMEDNANLSSAKKLYPIMFFNDYFRNMIGGSKNGNKGFILGDAFDIDTFKNLIINGSMNNMPFISYSQSINYLECHDNFTLRDKVNYLTNDFKKLKNACKLGLGLVIISKGISFIHAGEELMRSKQGVDNSYNLPDCINHFPFENLYTDCDLSEYVRTLISFKKNSCFEHLDNVIKKTSYFELRFNYNQYQVLIKNNYENDLVYFCPNTKLIFKNGDFTNKKCESLILDEPGIWILEK